MIRSALLVIDYNNNFIMIIKIGQYIRIYCKVLYMHNIMYNNGRIYYMHYTIYSILCNYNIIMIIITIYDKNRL